MRMHSLPYDAADAGERSFALSGLAIAVATVMPVVAWAAGLLDFIVR